MSHLIILFVLPSRGGDTSPSSWDLSAPLARLSSPHPRTGGAGASKGGEVSLLGGKPSHAVHQQTLTNVIVIRTNTMILIVEWWIIDDNNDNGDRNKKAPGLAGECLTAQQSCSNPWMIIISLLWMMVISIIILRIISISIILWMVSISNLV